LKDLGTVIKKSINDFFSSPFLGMSILPFVLTTMILFGIFLYIGGEFFQFLSADFDNGIVPFIDPTAHPFITSILAFSFVKWIVITFFYLIGGAFIILVSVITATLIIGFFTPKIVKILRERHYSDIKLKSDFTTTTIIWLYTKLIAAFIGLMLLCIPLLLLPGVNLLIFNIPFYYLFHNMLVIDVASNINTQQEYKIIKKNTRGMLYGATMIFYILSLIPLVGMIFTVLFVIAISHIMFLKTREIRRQEVR